MNRTLNPPSIKQRQRWWGQLTHWVTSGRAPIVPVDEATAVSAYHHRHSMTPLLVSREPFALSSAMTCLSCWICWFDIFCLWKTLTLRWIRWSLFTINNYVKFYEVFMFQIMTLWKVFVEHSKTPQILNFEKWNIFKEIGSLKTVNNNWEKNKEQIN